MKIRPLRIDHAFEIAPVRHEDYRGSYQEIYRHDLLAEAVGHALRLEQWNLAVSRAGVIRSIHFADVPDGQAKYLTCARGAGLDVVVDLRAGSPTFGEYDTVELDDIERRAVYVGEGLGHAFFAYGDDTVITYLCSSTYNPAKEHAINPLDPGLAIAWPKDPAPVLSERDVAAPTLAQAEERGMLPRYEDCLKLYAGNDEQAQTAAQSQAAAAEVVAPA